MAAILVLTLWGFALRIYALGQQSLWNDEAATINAAFAMLEHGWPLLPSGEVYSRSILNTGIIAPSLALFGSSEFAARLPSVLFGTLTIPVVFLFARKVSDDKVALIAAIITAFSVLEIAWSRQARMYQQLQFFFILSLYFFYLFNQTKSKRYLILTILSTICTILSHELGFILILVFLIYAFVFNIRSIKKFFSRQFLLQKKVVVSILFIVALLALGEIEFGIFSRLLSYYPWAAEPDKYGWFVLITLLTIIVLAAARDVLLFNKRNRLVLFTIIALYFLSFHLGLWEHRYIYFLLPIVFILFSYAVAHSSDLIPKLGAKRISSLLLPALLLGLTLSYGFVFTPHSCYYNFAPGIHQPDFKRAYSFVEENMGEDDVVIHAWTTLGRFYLEKTPDYWLQWDTTGKHVKVVVANGEPQEWLTGAPVIEDLDELKDVIQQNERGWIVVDSFAWNLLPEDTRDFIMSDLHYYEEGSSTGEQGDVMVYGW